MAENTELDCQLLTYTQEMIQSWKLKNSAENRAKLASSYGRKGKGLPKIPVSMEILYEFNPDSDKNKRPKWCKGTVTDRLNPRKYQILTDNDRVITRSRKTYKGLQD